MKNKKTGEDETKVTIGEKEAWDIPFYLKGEKNAVDS